MLPTRLQPGRYCISATYLQAVYDYDTPARPWTPTYEHTYQAARADWMSYQARPSAELDRLRETGDQGLLRATYVTSQLRAARLLAYLRTREPVAMAGRSILIFDVTARDLEHALAGPPDRLR